MNVERHAQWHNGMRHMAPPCVGRRPDAALCECSEHGTQARATVRGRSLVLAAGSDELGRRTSMHAMRADLHTICAIYLHFMRRASVILFSADVLELCIE